MTAAELESLVLMQSAITAALARVLIESGLVTPEELAQRLQAIPATTPHADTARKILIAGLPLVGRPDR